MKSKKIVALALTAAMAISMASMTAFAKVDYTDGATPASLDKAYATLELTADEQKAVDAFITANQAEATAMKVTKSTAGDYSMPYSFFVSLKEGNELKDLDNLNTPTKTYLGWQTPNATQPTGTVVAAAATLTDSTLLKFEKAKSYKLYSKVAWRDDKASDEQINKNIEAINKAKEKNEAAKTREEHLKEEDKNHNATDNINTGTGVETKPADVDFKGDLGDMGTTVVHDLQVAGVDPDAHELAWVYEVTPPTNFMKTTKNARVTLDLPDGYTTDNYKVTVYHVKGWCSKQKVTGLDVGKYDVTFWANDFSPYVLILTPKGATSTGTSTNNPGTGDFSAVPVALLAAAALGATGFVAYKKRKAE